MKANTHKSGAAFGGKDLRKMFHGKHLWDHSRAYLHYLINAGEIVGTMLLTEINLGYYQDPMEACAVRTSGSFDDFCVATKEAWRIGEASRKIEA